MAFTRNTFLAASSQANNDAPRMWMYRTNDLATDVDTAGYFNGVSDLVAVGDLIYAHVDADGTAGFVLYPVVSNAAGVVDVSDGTALSVADTD